jgi:hypothetical protein
VYVPEKKAHLRRSRSAIVTQTSWGMQDGKRDSLSNDKTNGNNNVNYLVKLASPAIVLQCSCFKLTHISNKHHSTIVHRGSVASNHDWTLSNVLAKVHVHLSFRFPKNLKPLLHQKATLTHYLTLWKSWCSRTYKAWIKIRVDYLWDCR